MVTHEVCTAITPSCVAFSILRPRTDDPDDPGPAKTMPFCRPDASMTGQRRPTTCKVFGIVTLSAYVPSPTTIRSPAAATATACVIVWHGLALVQLAASLP